MELFEGDLGTIRHHRRGTSFVTTAFGCCAYGLSRIATFQPSAVAGPDHQPVVEIEAGDVRVRRPHATGATSAGGSPHRRTRARGCHPWLHLVAPAGARKGVGVRIPPFRTNSK